MDAVGAALLPKFGGYVVETATAEALALVGDDRDEAERLRREGEEYLAEAEACGHPAAPAWTRARRPVRVRIVTAGEAEEIREGGPLPLQYEG